MLGDIQLAKKKIGLGVTKFVSQYIDQYYEEVHVWDDAFLKAYFEHTRDIYVKLSNDNADGRYAQELKGLAEEMILICSNSFSNLEFAIHLSKKNGNYLLEALEGLYAYDKGEKEESYYKLYSFISKRDCHINHYLINKTLGMLSMEMGRKQDAVEFITMALQKKSTELALYEMLYELYEDLNKEEEKQVIKSVIKMLRG